VFVVDDAGTDGQKHREDV